MKITNAWFKKQNACIDGYKWVLKRESDDAKDTMEALIKHNLEWASWTIVRLLNRKDKIRYAIYAARQVLGIFEEKHPNDKRPRLAIEAAEKVLKKDTQENRKAAAGEAAWAADAAGEAAWAAAEAAGEAAGAAAWAAADAAGAAAWAAAEAAGEAARAAAWAAAEAAGEAAGEAAWAAMKEKIVRYGMKLYFAKKKGKKNG